MRARNGFTLAELLVALMVFAVGALAMAKNSANLMTMITSSKSRTVAAQVAESRFERMRSQPCSAHTSDSASARGVVERWTTVSLVRADDVTVRVSFVSGRRVASQTYRSFLPC